MISTVTTTGHDAGRRRIRTAIIAASLLLAAAGSVVLLTSGPSEQATTKGVTATLHLPGSPNFAVVTLDGLWVSTHGSDVKQNIAPSGQLLHINLATGTVQQTVRLSGSASYLVLDGNRVIADPGIAGTSTAGAAPGELIAVDTRTGRVLARRHEQIAGGPMAVGDGALWEIHESYATTPTTLEELNPTTLSPIAPPLALSPTSAVHDLAWGDGHVGASDDAGEVLRIDPATRAITRAHLGGFLIGIGLAGGSIWVIDNSNATIKQLDPTTLRVIRQSVSVPSGQNFYLGATEGYVFVADDSNGTITRIDTRTGKSTGPPIRIAPASSAGFGSAYAIAPAGTAIWATSPSTNTISRIQANP
jgi:outer membrane protein assembly factor BamB